ncbi:MAG: MFS transporter [Alphaproteobacteria bacterium]|nr:MFS transporter [Alphaproteobacteria bacterium]
MTSNRFSLSILRIRNFRLLVLTRVFTIMAMQAQAVVVGWQIYSLTKSPLLLGLVGLSEAVPGILCSLLAGHVVDVGHPHRIYKICIALLMINTLGMLVIAGGLLPLADNTIVISLFVGVFVSGIARGFLSPSVATLRAQILPLPSQQAAASAWLTSGFQVSAVGGPAVAGLVYGGYGALAAWILPACSLLLAWVLALAIKVDRPVRSARRESAGQSIRAGWAFIVSNPVLLSVMALDMFAVLFGGAVAMLPAYADQVLHVGSEGLGALRAAPAMGAVVTAVTLALRPLPRMSAKTLLLVVAGFGLCIIGFGLSQWFYLSMALLALSGAFDCVSMVIRSTLVQLLTPPAMMGRVQSVSTMFVISSNEIGAFESGMAAQLMGLVPSVVAGGVATLLVVAATATLSPKFRRTVVQSDGSIT